MANKNERVGNRSLTKIKQNKWAAACLVLAFLAVGIFIVYHSFAGGVSVFNDNPDYWRPRIAKCESGGRTNATNGQYTGLYQISLGLWRGTMGTEIATQYPTAGDAPAAIQDEAFNRIFARRGTQPWNSSYSCWIKGAVVPASFDDQIGNVVAAPTPPAKPFGITSGSYNVVVNGRITLNDKPLAGVKLLTCSADRIATTDADGWFSFGIPTGIDFCIRPTEGVPVGVKLDRIANNVEHVKDTSFEYQKAGVNCYKQFWCFLSPAFTWDRSRDSGYNFFYTKE